MPFRDIVVGLVSHQLVLQLIASLLLRDRQLLLGNSVASLLMKGATPVCRKGYQIETSKSKFIHYTLNGCNQLATSEFEFTRPQLAVKCSRHEAVDGAAVHLLRLPRCELRGRAGLRPPARSQVPPAKGQFFNS